MIRLKFTKILAVILAANLLVEPLSVSYGLTRHVQAEEVFSDIHALYNDWCSNNYQNFPENVGDLYCYYYSNSNPTSTVNGEVEIPADQDYVLVVGLVEHTKEAEQEILSKLSDKSHITFITCKYSHKELEEVNKEISQMMTQELGICGVGTTCSLDENSISHEMKQYVEVMILPEFYEKTSNILIEKYGDRVRTSSGMAVVDTMDKKIDTNDWYEENLYHDGTDVDIGGDLEPVYTVGMEGVQKQETTNHKNEFKLSHTTAVLMLGDTFVFKGSWKKADKMVWSIAEKNKIKVLSKRADGCDFKIQAKKTGYITIKVKNKTNNKMVSQKVLILDKNGTVANQEKLIAALQSKDIKKVTIKTKEKKKFTIPEGNYGNKKLIINAPKSEIIVKEPKILETMVIKEGKQIRIMGITEEKAKQVFGEPVGTLSGLAGDIFHLENGTEIIVYYDSSMLTEARDDMTVNVDLAETRKDPLKVEDNREEFKFTGTILEIYDDTACALVEPEEETAIRSSGDRVVVKLGSNTKDNFFVGDKVIVYYDGVVAESYPLQIPNIYLVCKIEK